MESHIHPERLTRFLPDCRDICQITITVFQNKILMSNRHQVKNGEQLVSDSEYSCGLAFGFGGMHSCSIGQVVVNINKNEVKKEDD